MSMSSLASTAARIFSTCSSMGITAFFSMWPQRLGNTWSSSYDCLSARLVEQAGFEAAFMTGFGASGSILGQPDYGLAAEDGPGDIAVFHGGVACNDAAGVADADQTALPRWTPIPSCWSCWRPSAALRRSRWGLPAGLRRVSGSGPFPW